MGTPLKYIIVGTGGFGRYWCAQVLPRLTELGKAEPAAAVDLNPAALKNAQQHLKLPPEKCYGDVARAFDENKADFAIVVVPPAHHEPVVDVALAHGCHILSEKPIADTMEACCRIYHKIKKAGKKMAVTMSHRFDQDKQSLQRLIHSGKYGRLDYLIGRNTWMARKFAQWGNFRYKIPDPLLIEGTVHHFDIIRSLAGANANTVHTISWNPEWSEFQGDCQALILIEMANGVKCLYEGAKANASALNGWTQDYWRAECDKATLELDQRRLRVITGAFNQNAVIEQLPLLQQPAWMNPWLAELFVDWLNGAEAPPNNIEDNIQCAALLFAAIESAHAKQIVDVQAYLAKHLRAC